MEEKKEGGKEGRRKTSRLVRQLSGQRCLHQSWWPETSMEERNSSHYLFSDLHTRGGRSHWSWTDSDCKPPLGSPQQPTLHSLSLLKLRPWESKHGGGWRNHRFQNQCLSGLRQLYSSIVHLRKQGEPPLTPWSSNSINAQGQWILLFPLCLWEPFVQGYLKYLSGQAQCCNPTSRK